MKMLIIGDLHGAIPKIHFKEFDFILAPGDFCSSDARKYMFKTMIVNEKNPEKFISWKELAGKEKAKELIKKSFDDGRRVLEKLNSIGVPVFVVPGNWEKDEEKSLLSFLKKNNYQKLIKGLKNVIDVHYKLRDIGEYQIVGYGINSGPELPREEDMLFIPRRETSRILKEFKTSIIRLAKLFRRAKKPVIFLSHNVPFNTKIDKVKNRNSPANGEHMGSIIARELIENFKPILAVGGHIHEHHSKCNIWDTVCLNAGFGGKANTLVEIKNGKVKKVSFFR